MKRIAIVVVMLWTGLAFGLEGSAPACTSKGQPLPVNNDQVAQWKATSANEYHDRGHVTGKITALFANQTGHNHFEITLDGANPTTVEIVYDLKFGALPALKVGDSVEACGDYITSNAPYQGYPVSPDGALIHWVHRTDTPNHAAGFTIVNNVVYGQN